jgi:NAD(P)-dependent dehydrogenase (short-subunit alcohol dehydrogenase family)
MTWTAADIPDLTGRVAVVTGANGGLGLETARELARKGAHVVMAARNQEKAKTAHDAIIADLPDASLEIVELDLASLDSVRAAAEKVASGHSTIDILVNNAGLMGIPERKTADGFEMQLGTNHLGHFLLTGMLFPNIERADAARIVTTTSTARVFGRPVDPDNPHLEGRYGPWRAYGQSKLANYHFATELHYRLRDAESSVASLVAHPGFTNTELQATSVAHTDGGTSQRFFHEAVQRVGMTPLEGALPQLRAATDPGAKSGQMYTPRWVNNGPPVRRTHLRGFWRPPAIALWDVSERETGFRFEVGSPDARP